MGTRVVIREAGGDKGGEESGRKAVSREEGSSLGRGGCQPDRYLVLKLSLGPCRARLALRPLLWALSQAQCPPQVHQQVHIALRVPEKWASLPRAEKF